MTRPLPAVLLLAACGFSSTGHPGGGGEPPPGVPPCGIICGMRKGWTEEASMLELDCEPVIIGNPREVRRLGGSGVMTWRAQCWRGVYRCRGRLAATDRDAPIIGTITSTYLADVQCSKERHPDE